MSLDNVEFPDRLLYILEEVVRFTNKTGDGPVYRYPRAESVRDNCPELMVIRVSVSPVSISLMQRFINTIFSHCRATKILVNPCQSHIPLHIPLSIPLLRPSQDTIYGFGLAVVWLSDRNVAWLNRLQHSGCSGYSGGVRRSWIKNNPQKLMLFIHIGAVW